jgi:hypothetical protein
MLTYGQDLLTDERAKTCSLGRSVSAASLDGGLNHETPLFSHWLVYAIDTGLVLRVPGGRGVQPERGLPR